MDKYSALEKEVKAIQNKVPVNRSDAFYQLVYYPVMCASWINKKFLYRDKADLYAKQNRLSAFDYASWSKPLTIALLWKQIIIIENLLMANGKP